MHKSSVIVQMQKVRFLRVCAILKTSCMQQSDVIAIMICFRGCQTKVEEGGHGQGGNLLVKQ